MKILSAKFIRSVTDHRQIPAFPFPEIAFAGRSNVGKSTLINCLLKRKGLALISSTPGKTRMINYYHVNENLLFVDLPGYGYAKVPQNERRHWKLLIESYITSSRQLKGIIQIVDSRIGATRLDLEMIAYISHLKKPALIVATKIDKLPKSRANHLLARNFDNLTAQYNLELIPFSATTGQGSKEIWLAIHNLLKDRRL